jgi:GNAT superfamily N-acetyltransferase
MVDIRRVSPADWPTLRRVRLAALDEAPYAFGSTYEREVTFDENDWLGRLKRAAYFVAFDLDEPVGLVGGFSPTSRPTAREVVSMWVEPSRRGGKLADRLLTTVMDWARDDGAGEVSLWIADDNEAARRFFIRYGFARTGHRQPLWGHVGVEADEYLLVF